MSQLGHLDHITAFEFVHHLWLGGNGTNPTSGWANWIEPIRMPNAYEFQQQPPSGPALQIVVPFKVLGVFPATGAKEVTMRHLVDGKPADVRIHVHAASPIEEAAVLGMVPEATLQFLKARKGEEGAATAVGATFSKHLGTVDIPFLCGTWSNPTRARRYELYLEVDAMLPSPSDIERVVTDCLKQSAIAAALIVLMTPVGWAAGLGAFEKLLEACLLSKLGHKLVSVRLPVRNHCL